MALAIAVLPSLYAWLNIYSNWDPYGNTGNISIAVASLDKGWTEEDGTQVNKGREVVEDLRSSTSINWVIVDTKEEAEREMIETITNDVRRVLIPRTIAALPEHLRHFLDTDFILHVNPTGKFVIGGPHGDTGLTGRKIIVDTYGGHGAHGGGAFSGKDPSKVDRSAAYAARHIAKNLVAAGVCREALVQVAYAIGVARPVSLYVNTRGTAKVSFSDAEISAKVSEIFDMRPAAIERRLKLRAPIYLETATYGHVGRTPRAVTKTFRDSSGATFTREVELFTWEKLDHVEPLRAAFGL